MIVFGGEESLKRRHLRDDRAGPQLLSGQFFDHFFCHQLLLIGCGEDGRAVLRAHVSALAVERGRVVNGEEDVQDVFEGDHTRVKGDLDHLGMSGGTAAHLFVGGIWTSSARVARDHVRDALDLVKDRLEAPEASAREDGVGEGICCHNKTIILLFESDYYRLHPAI